MEIEMPEIKRTLNTKQAILLACLNIFSQYFTELILFQKTDGIEDVTL